MNDMASIRKIRPLPAAATRWVLGGGGPGEPVDATTAFDVVCFLGGKPQVYQAGKLTFYAVGAWKQDAGGYIEEPQKARGPEGLFAFRATGRGVFVATLSA